jgi:hypothetical protein
MAADTKELLIELQLQNKQLIKQVSETDAKFAKLNKQQTKTQGILGKIKASYLALAATLVILGRGMVKATKLAVDFEEANSKFMVVFRGVTKEANAMRQELVDSFGVSTLGATNMLASIQDLLVPMGLARDKAADLSGEFAKAAVDLASFNNVPVDVALQKITSGLAGQSEPLRQWGILVNEGALKQMALERGMELVNGRITSQQRATLVLAQIHKQGADAMGDMQRTQESVANQTKILQASWEDLQLAVGNFLKSPAVSGVLKWLIDVTKAAGKMLNAMAKVSTELRSNMIALQEFGVESKEQVEAVENLASAYEKWEDANKTIKEFLKTRDELAKQGRDFQQEINENIDGAGKFAVVWHNAKQTLKESGAEMEKFKKILQDTQITTGKQALEIWAQLTKARKENSEQNKQSNKEDEESNRLTKEQMKEVNALFRESEKEAEDQTLQEKLDRINILLEAAKAGSDEEKKLLQAKATFTEMLEEERRQSASLTHNLLMAMQSEEVQATQSALSNISSMTSSTNKTLFKIGKAAGIADATISAAQAVVKTMASVPYPWNIPLSIAQAAAGAVQVNKISNTRFVGKQRGGVIDNVMGSPINGEDGMIAVQRGEGILTREAVVNLGRDTINELNRTGGTSGTERPIINIEVNNNRPEETVAVINDYFRDYGTNERGEAL